MTFILCPFPLSSINKISSAIGSKKLESQMRLRTLIQHLFCTGDSNSGNFSAWPPTGQHPWDSVSFFFLSSGLLTKSCLDPAALCEQQGSSRCADEVPRGAGEGSSRLPEGGTSLPWCFPGTCQGRG